MKSKILSLALLTLILSVSIVCALDFSVSTPEALTKVKTQTSFTITNNGLETINLKVTLPTTISDGKGNEVTISPITAVIFNDVAPAATKNVELKYTGDLAKLALGEFSKDISVYAVDIADPTKNLTKTTSLKALNTYCSAGNLGDLEIDRLKFTNNGLGSKDEWYLTDEIDVELRVNNDGDEDIDDVVVEWGLYNEQTGDFIIEEEEKSFNLDSDEKETLNFKFKLDPNDFDADDDEDDFVFYARAYSDDLGEEISCTSNSENIKIMRDKHFVVINGLIVSSNVVPCGGFLEGDFEVWNIGNSDEDDVSVLITNAELGISEKLDIGTLDILEDKKLTFNIKIPQNEEEKIYTLRFEVLDEDGDVFQNDNDEESKTSLIVDVQGNCGKGEEEPTLPGVLITADLDPETPEAVAGKQVIVKTSLRNTGDAETTYIVSVVGNSAWSSLNSIDPRAITLAPGESKIVNIILDIDANAEGNKEFTITANYGDKVTEQKVALTVSKPQTAVTTDLGPIGEHLKKNWFIYLIVLVNIILIIAIIIVIARMVSPRM